MPYFPRSTHGVVLKIKEKIRKQINKQQKPGKQGSSFKVVQQGRLPILMTFFFITLTL